MIFKHLTEADRAKWEETVMHNSASGFMQSFFWTDFKRMTGWKTYKIGLFEDEQLIGGAIVMKYFFANNKNFLYIPQGPVLPYDTARTKDFWEPLLNEIKTMADSSGKSITTHLRIDPRLKRVPPYFSGFSKAPYNMTPRCTSIIDLSKTETEMLRRMKQKGRYNIQVAKRHNAKVYADTSRRGITSFLGLYRETALRNKFKSNEEAYFKLLIPLFSSSHHGELFFAEQENVPLSAAIVIFYGDTATYFFGASSGQNREAMAPYLLQWEIMRHAKARGCRRYDLYGIAPGPEDAPHAWYGFTAFKRKFGGEEHAFIGAYDYVFNKKLYEEFLEESKEKPS